MYFLTAVILINKIQSRKYQTVILKVKLLQKFFEKETVKFLKYMQIIPHLAAGLRLLAVNR